MRHLKLFCAVVLLVSLSACPFALRIQPGLWGFSLDGDPGVVGLQMLFNGQTETLPPGPFPQGVNSTFSGTLTWSQSGDTVTIVQETTVGGPAWIYTGVVTDRTSMSGTFVRTDSMNLDAGYWGAVRLDD